jgi:ribosomal protein S6E (S10)
LRADSRLLLGAAAGTHFLPEEQVGQRTFDIGDRLAGQAAGRVAEQARSSRIGGEDDQGLGVYEEQDLLGGGEQQVLVAFAHCRRPLRESESK